mmetsp:Transcript_155332/g.496643  ORF Transcript_155332/g.496643 Transcript_155332/m.496643 type:complete len:315 (+) Transcript_155332:28-972(+)
MRSLHVKRLRVASWLLLLWPVLRLSLPKRLHGRLHRREALCLVAGASSPVPGRPCQHFLLARHGQTTFNAEKRFQGSMDEEPVLNEKGIRQARELGDWLRNFCDAGEAAGKPAMSSVFCSPLRRARQTLAEARDALGGDAAAVLPPEPETVIFPELREIDLYEWQGRTQAEVKESDPELMRLWKESAWELRLGGGRSVIADLWSRASAVWCLMRAAAAPAAGPAAEPSLVVAHGTLGRALLSAATGLPVQAFRHFGLKNGEVVEVAWPQDADGKSEGGAFWRRRHPEEGPWRSSAVEQASFEQESVEVGVVDVA